MPAFALGPSVHDNVKALRKALGSVVDELSQAKLAALVQSAHPERKVSASQVQRWEADVEPDYLSVVIMARLAGVTFEEFALGDPKKRVAIKVAPRFRAVLDDAERERKRA